MFLNEKRGRVVLGFAIFFIGLIFYLATLTHFSIPKPTWSKITFSSFYNKPSNDLEKLPGFSSWINLLDYREVVKETLLTEKQPFNCPVVEVFDLKFPICLFPIEKDNIVSNAAKSGSTYWEKDIIGRLINLLHRLRQLSERHEREIVFFDLGTNIGTYSLPILQSGFKVVNVDAQWQALQRYSFSLHLANLTDTHQVTILHNAVSTESGTILNIQQDSTNVGAAFVVPIGPCLTSECNKTLVRTITLNEVLPFAVDKSTKFLNLRPQVVMKVDIQGSESRVFTEDSAAKFFDATDVILVQVELWYPPGADADAPKRREAMIGFFTRRGYSIRDASVPDKYYTLAQLMSSSYFDVLFTKKGLDRLI